MNPRRPAASPRSGIAATRIVRSRRLAGLIVATTLIVTPFVAADWVILKDGVQIHGKVIRHDRREVSLVSENGGVLTFRMNLVREVHRSIPEETPPQSAVKPQARTPAAVVKFDEQPHPGEREVYGFGNATLALPPGFEDQQLQSRYESYVGELLGLYQHPKTEARVSVSQGPFPFQSKSFAEMQTRLRHYLHEQSRYDVRVFESREFDGLRGVYAEFEERHEDGPLVHLQAWIPVGRHRIYSVGISVGERTWRAGAAPYRDTVQSFRYRSSGRPSRSPASPGF